MAGLVGGVDVPAVVGKVTPITLEFMDGSSTVFIKHHNPGIKPYLSVAVEISGGSAAFTGGQGWTTAYVQWSGLLARLARQGSFIRTVQEISRSVKYDLADHMAWIGEKVPYDAGGSPAVHPVLMASYQQVLDRVENRIEQHRTWAVLRIPMTTRWHLAAGKKAGGDRGHALLAWDQVQIFAERAAQIGLGVRTLSQARLAAVIRGLLDPSWPLDQVYQDEGTVLNLSSCWPQLDARQDGHLIVGTGEDRVWLKTAVIPRDGIEPGVKPVDFLRPLLTGVDPSTTRTISSIVDLAPPHKARQEARQDVVRDGAQVAESANTVSDGGAEIQQSASAQRLYDLSPGSGAAGGAYSLSLTITARSADELASATETIEATAADSHIHRLDWCAWTQDIEIINTLPFARGIRVRK